MHHPIHADWKPEMSSDHHHLTPHGQHNLRPKDTQLILCRESSLPLAEEGCPVVVDPSHARMRGLRGVRGHIIWVSPGTARTAVTVRRLGQKWLRLSLSLCPSVTLLYVYICVYMGTDCRDREDGKDCSDRAEDWVHTLVVVSTQLNSALRPKSPSPNFGIYLGEPPK